MALIYKNFENLNYIFVNVVYNFIVIKLNYFSIFHLNKNKIMPKLFGFFIIKHLENFDNNRFVYYFVINYKMQNLTIEIFYTCNIFFILHKSLFLANNKKLYIKL